MKMIQQTNENEYVTDNGRGTKFTIVRKANGGWTVFSDNAMRRAYGGLGCKEFDTLEDIEANYKSLRGLAKLLSGEALVA